MVLRQKSGDVPALIAVDPDTSVRRALEEIEDNNVSQLPVLVGGECVGTVSEAVLMARLLEKPDLIDAPVKELMEKALPMLDAGTDFESVTRKLIGGEAAVVVRQNGEPVGIITRFDVVHFLTGFGR
jgi:cystathionine beta-synthase